MGGRPAAEGSDAGRGGGRAERFPEMDAPAPEWHHSGIVDDLFKQKARWRPVLVAGALLFLALGLASLVEAFRGAPLVLHGEVVAVRIEAFCYRAAACLLCWISAGWLYVLARPEREEIDMPG